MLCDLYIARQITGWQWPWHLYSKWPVRETFPCTKAAVGGVKITVFAHIQTRLRWLALFLTFVRQRQNGTYVHTDRLQRLVAKLKQDSACKLPSLAPHTKHWRNLSFKGAGSVGNRRIFLKKATQQLWVKYSAHTPNPNPLFLGRKKHTR